MCRSSAGVPLVLVHVWPPDRPIVRVEHEHLYRSARRTGPNHLCRQLIDFAERLNRRQVFTILGAGVTRERHGGQFGASPLPRSA